MSKPLAVIAGAAGFIGTSVVQEFATQGWRVIGIGHGSPVEEARGRMAFWKESDITESALANLQEHISVIIHCAGGASVGASIENPGLDLERSVKTTSGMLEYIRRHSPKTSLVYLSSAAVYGEVSEIPILEDAPLRPVSPYGYHKVMCEALCRMYSRQYGVKVAIVRPFSIFGVGLRKQLLWDACQKYSKNDCNFFGTGKEIRDWLYVGDLSKLLFIAVDKVSENCSVVNAGSGIGVSNEDLLTYLGARFGESRLPNFSLSPKSGDPKAYVAANYAALGWGWFPTLTWQEGVDAYVDWYKQCR